MLGSHSSQGVSDRARLLDGDGLIQPRREGDRAVGVLAGRAVAVRHRILHDDVRNMQDALARGCPLYVSARLHTGWYRLFLADSGTELVRREDDKVLGRHACVIAGYDETGFWIHNSWGVQWGSGWEALLWGRNLTDENWLQSAFPSVAQAGSYSGYPNQPRTYGLSLTKRWN